MSVSVQIDKDKLHITPPNRLGFGEGAVLRESLLANCLGGQTYTTVVVDLSATNEMHDAAFDAVINFCMAEANNGKKIEFKIGKQLKHYAEITQLQLLFPYQVA